MQTRHCTSCGADVTWTTTVRDRPFPLDAKPFADQGTKPPASLAGLFFLAADTKAHAAMVALDLVDAKGKLLRPLYLSHWVTCRPRAASSGKAKTPAKKGKA